MLSPHLTDFSLTVGVDESGRLWVREGEKSGGKGSRPPACRKITLLACKFIAQSEPLPRPQCFSEKDKNEFYLEMSV